MSVRDRILEAALECFTEDGYDRTTIARIRERSEVTNGALFHYFPSKDAIAEALYLDAMASVQEQYWAVLQQRPVALTDAVNRIVRVLISWVEANQTHARFLYSRGHLDWSTSAGGELKARNYDLASAYRDWLAPFIASGEARDLPMAIVVAVVTGPAHAIAQRWLAGQLRGSLLDYADDLVDAAVAALSNSATKRRRRQRRLPAEGRVRVQLLTTDGTVIADGEAIAELTEVRAGTSKRRAEGGA
jgi:AcrR family transcriptional regulator